MTTARQPAIFLPHGGGPCFFMDWTWGPADTWHATQRIAVLLLDSDIRAMDSNIPAWASRYDHER